MLKASEIAYAKVNLFLGITEKRSDGFHGLSTVMHSLSLSDRLSVRIERSVLPEIRLSVTPKCGIPEDERNLVWKAAKAYLDYVGCCLSLDITLEKTIPSEAGLGGGSSDAAATLRMLDRALGYALPTHELSAIAEKLGSDVPFCLYGGTALCTGRGERIVRIPEAPHLYAVICKGSESVSTPKAYGALDRMFCDFSDPTLLPPQSAEKMAAHCRSGNADSIARTLYNVFEDAVYPACPEAKKQKETLLALGADGALLSGSGSAVFGLFPDFTMAKLAAEKIGGLAFAIESAPESIRYDV